METFLKFHRVFSGQSQAHSIKTIKITWRHVFLFAAMAAYVTMAWLSGMNLDLARDTRVAIDIIEGQSYPLLGPILAGQVRLGAGWYYLLAGLYSFTGGWLGTMVLLYLIGALQFPLAYLAGKAWKNRTAGLIWAALLMIPSWSFFELVFPTHTLLTAPLSLATILFVLRFWRGERNSKYFYLSVLFFSLALHGHPTAVVLIFPVLTTFIYLLIQCRSRLTLIFFSLLAGLMPFLTLLLHQIKNGFTVEAMIGNYISQQSWRWDGRRLLELVWQLSGGGWDYWVASMSDWPGGMAAVLTFIFALTMLFGIGGFIYSKLWKLPVHAWALSFLVGSVAVVFLIRGNYPYYMLTTVHTGLLGFLAAGLASLFHKVRIPIFILMASCLVSFLGSVFQVFMFQKNGNWNISIFPLYDVVAKNHDPHHLAIVPAYAFLDGVRWFCGHEPLSVHGALAVNLLQNYALEYRLGCPDKAVELGGNDPSRMHWIGLPRHMLPNLAAKNIQHFGPLRLWHARPISENKITNVRRLDYPPVEVNNNSLKPVKFVFEMQPGEHLAITNFGAFFMPFPDPKIKVAGRLLEPIAKDWMVKVYYCESCNAGIWTIEFERFQSDLLDIAAF